MIHSRQLRLRSIYGVTGTLARTARVGLTAGLLLSLSACSLLPGSATPTPVVTAPQAALAGEWILTRTVTVSDDTTDPTKALGAVSTRLVLIKQERCGAAICAGTVASGVAADGRTTTALNQSDGGLSWIFEGTLGCLNAATGEVQVPDAFTFDSVTTLVVAESADVDGALSASLLTGTTVVNDSLSLDASQRGCHRMPAATHVEYAVSAVRAPVTPPTSPTAPATPAATQAP
jgi:hypothetical protein